MLLRALDTFEQRPYMCLNSLRPFAVDGHNGWSGVNFHHSRTFQRFRAGYGEVCRLLTRASGLDDTRLFSYSARIGG